MRRHTVREHLLGLFEPRHFQRLQVLDNVSFGLRPGVSPVSALLMTARIFFNYFTMEILFNVPQPYGKDAQEVIREIADVLRNGMLA